MKLTSGLLPGIVNTRSGGHCERSDAFGLRLSGWNSGPSVGRCRCVDGSKQKKKTGEPHVP
jgi:hypothetical protein